MYRIDDRDEAFKKHTLYLYYILRGVDFRGAELVPTALHLAFASSILHLTLAIFFGSLHGETLCGVGG